MNTTITTIKKIAIICICILTCSQLAISQSLVRKNAETNYQKLAYVEAVNYYKDLASGKNALEDDIRRTAYCYVQLQDYQNAVKYYKQLSEKYTVKRTEQDLNLYAQSLKYTKNYTAADEVIKQLKALNAKNLIAANHSKLPNYYKQLKEDSSNYHITNLASLNTEYSEFSPIFFKGKQLMSFSSNRKTSAGAKKFAWDDSYFIDIYNSKKKDSVSFTEIQNLPKKVLSKYHDGPIVLSKNEQTMWLTRTNYIDKKIGTSTSKTVNLKLFSLKKDSLTGEWTEGESFAYNSNEYSIGHAALSADETKLYFVSDMPGGFGQTDLWVSEKGKGKWQQPRNLGQGINTEGREMFPYVFEDGTLFFSSDGRAGLGGLDVYFMPIEVDEYFEPQNLGYPINTSADDFGFYLNSDFKTGYVSSNREGGKGKDDIYYFRSKEAILGSSITGFVYDDNTKKIVPDAIVYLMNSDNTKILDSVKVSKDGSYAFNGVDASKQYNLVFKDKNHYDKILPIIKLNSGDNKINAYLQPKYRIVCTVYDGKTSEELPGVVSEFTDVVTKQLKTYTTDNSGTFVDELKNKKKGDVIHFSVKFAKKGYVTTMQDYKVTLGDELTILVENTINTKLLKLEIGTNLADAIKINPIYFDLNKYNIRPDGAIELDKIVALMRDNKTMVVELGSHTDCRSSKAYNLSLSDKRAKASAEYIISKGIEKARIYGKGYGESKLINNCECEGPKTSTCSEQQHQQNRRTEFIIVKN